MLFEIGVGARAVGHLARFRQKVEHAVKAGQVVLKLGHARREHGHRFQEHRQVHQKHHQIAQREPAVDNLHSPVEQERDRGHGQDEFPEQLDQP